MVFNRAVSYGIIATTYIAQHEGACTGQEVSEACGISAGHLLKVLQQLVKAHILTSERGPSGGFSMRGDPNKVTIHDVFVAVNGPIEGEFAGRSEIKGMNNAKSLILKACQDVAKLSSAQLSKITISQLAKK